MTRRSRPNILFITCDQWRGDCVSAAVGGTARTPNVDALAAEGVLFRSHYASAAPCSPARACLYTGLYQMNNRVCVNGTPLDARHDTVALAARRMGYDPTQFGYSDTAPDPRRFAPCDPLLASYEGVLPGFSVRVLLPEHQKPWLSWLAARGGPTGLDHPDIHRANGPGFDAPARYSRDETPAAFLAGEFIRWLGEQDGETPWFAHLSFISPHPPFVAPTPFNTMYAATDGPAFRRGASPDAERRLHPFVDHAIGTLEREKFVVGAEGMVADWTEDEFRRIRAVYFGMVSEVDAQLGRLWQALKQAGAWDDTIVALTSDHAELMGDHFMLGKGGFFDAAYHIPLIVRDPARPGGAGRIVDAFTEAVDIMPTLQQLMGETPHAHLDGRSLTPFLDGEMPASWRDAVHWEYDFRSISTGAAEQALGLRPQQCNLAVVRTGRWKYVHFGGGLPPVLFDLETDPGETRDLAGDPAMAGVRLEMAERLLAWRAEHLDQSLALAELTGTGVVGHVAPLRP